MTPLMNQHNPILLTDSYKFSHYKQYPPGTEYVYSYIEARGGDYDRTVLFGLQAFLMEYLRTKVTKEHVDYAEEVVTAHGLPFNREGWDYIVNEKGGKLPLVIKALEEGSVVPVGTPLVTVMNTDPKCFWLTSYIETALLRAIWYPTTVATISYHIKQIIKESLYRTSDDPLGQIPFKLHDFGARGASSSETAMLGGMAHLLNFQGTDTVEALLGARMYYGADMAGFSIPASEHSTMTSWGKEREEDAYRNMLQQFAKPGSLVAVVSDSYDIYNAIDKLWGDALKGDVIESGATVVIRPDSGDPVETPVTCVKMLADHFGVTYNNKGFKVLNDVRVIQGDGIGPEEVRQILHKLESEGFSADNIAFGMGAGLLQKVNRDTCHFAMKTSAVQIDGVWHDVGKNPVGQPDKNSKKGMFSIIHEHGKWETVRRGDGWDWANMLWQRYRDGEISKPTTFEEIRKRTEVGY